jgi:hypothetical protein
MSGIRPLEREDLPAIVRLYEQIMRGGEPAPHLVEFFERTLLDQPWADPEIPSLVYAEDGEILGFIASSVRRMRYEGSEIRLGCSGHLLSRPDARTRGVGALLLRAYLAGPQDLTISDGSTETVRRIWHGLGGDTVYLGCLSYIQVFRPWRLAADYLLGRPSLTPLHTIVGPVSSGLDAVARLVTGHMLQPEQPEGTVEQLTPAAMIEHLPQVTASLRLVPAYDRVYLDWLFQELAQVVNRGPLWAAGDGRRLVARGPLWAELVRQGDRVLGWYVCHLRRGGFCRVLQVAAGPRDAETVFGHLAYRARKRGAAGLYGRLEPGVFGPVSTGRSLLRVHEGRMLAHSRDRGILDAIYSGNSLVTRLDGEWW